LGVSYVSTQVSPIYWNPTPPSPLIHSLPNRGPA